MKNIIIVIVAVLVLGVGAFLLFGGSDDSSSTSQTQESIEASNDTNSDEPAPNEITIVYSSNGFSPTNSTVASGGTVTIKNEGDLDLDFASGNHPTHTENQEFNLGDVPVGESRSFTVTTTGTWDFHNHRRSSHGGVIIVK